MDRFPIHGLWVENSTGSSKLDDIGVPCLVSSTNFNFNDLDVFIFKITYC